jgi:cell division protein FtsW (lipid II flippase)
MPVDRRLFFNVDWALLAAVLILTGIGVATILSATFSGRNSGLEMKQLYAVALLAASVAAFLSFQVVYNVAMSAGLVPVKGLPLPFMSYGGSSVFSSFLALGLILNVRMRRFAN